MKESGRRIIQELMFAKDQKLRWSDLLEKTGLSKRALSANLKSLQEQTPPQVRRIVDAETKEYPPPVYYQRVSIIEREFSEKINREWNEMAEKTQKLFDITFKFKTPEVYLDEILKTILRDCVFTLYHAAFAPNILESTVLLEWHNRIHEKLMADTLKSFATSKRYRETLKKSYKVFREDLLEEEARIEKRRKQQGKD